MYCGLVGFFVYLDISRKKRVWPVKMYIFFLALSLFSTEIKRPDFIETEPFFFFLGLYYSPG